MAKRYPTFTRPGLSIVPFSHNKRLTTDPKRRPVHSVYRTGGTCPKDCNVWDFCYGKTGPISRHTLRVTEANPFPDLDELYRQEAEGILQLPRIGLLRGSVFGDILTPEGVAVVSAAQAQWSRETQAAHPGDRRQGVLINYTHVHERVIPRRYWAGGVPVLRSVETTRAAREAMDAGYAAAMVVPHFQQKTPYKLADDMTGQPCLKQTIDGMDCARCCLCAQTELLLARRTVILFETHSILAKVGQTVLEAIHQADEAAA